MRRKVKKWVTASDALKGAVKRLGLAKKMTRYEVWNRWEEIAGALICAHAAPSRWQGNTLVVAVEHPSWMQELSYLKGQLIARAREEIPSIDIADIRFEIGKPPPHEEKENKTLDTRPVPLSPDEKEFIEQAALQIKDEGARDTVRRLMTKDFQRKKRRS